MTDDRVFAWVYRYGRVVALIPAERVGAATYRLLFPYTPREGETLRLGNGGAALRSALSRGEQA